MSGKPDRVASIPSPPVSNFAQTLDPQADVATQTARLELCLPWILSIVAIFGLFYQLGSAALFEPDKGRNAEKARELLLLCLIGYWQPAILPKALVRGVTGMSGRLCIYGTVILGAVILALPLLFLSVQKISRYLHRQSHWYLVQTIIMILCLVFGAQSIMAASTGSSARAVSDLDLPLITPETQVVFYGHCLAGLGFYLRIAKPIWVVTHSRKKRTFLGNYYALGRHMKPRTRWGKALFYSAEFNNQWRLTQQPLLVVVKAKTRVSLEAQVGAATKKLASIDDYVLVTQP